jgi:uncharacterized protein (TIGR00299 family) protein
MNSVIFDIQFGASGDMLIASLLDCGLSLSSLKEELLKLGIHNWDISTKKINKYHISGSCIHISTGEGESRNINDIKDIIQNSGLSSAAKNNISKVFNRLASAEAKIHGTSVDDVHFHEVGAIDSIIDVSSFCIAMQLLEIERIFFNEFCFGRGTVNSSHGELPIPVPAVVELSRGFTSRLTDRSGELVTPTAAAILTTLGTQLDKPVSYTIINHGIGFGTRDYSFPSYTRALLVKTDEKDEAVVQLECNIDDMNPQLYPYIIERLLEGGALDAYISHTVMKKGRYGTLLTVISNHEQFDSLKQLIYRETTTLGIRAFNVIREKLDRKFDTVKVLDQEIRIKIGFYEGKIVNIHPEFEDCKKAAQKSGISLKEIMSKAREEYQKNLDHITLSSSGEKI